MKTVSLKLCTLLLFLTGCTAASSSEGERSPAEGKPYHAVVAADGSGDHQSVQAAIDAVPDGRTEPWKIFIKNGTYQEWVLIPETKRFVHLIGEDRDNTVISYTIHCGGPDSGPWELSCHNTETNNGNRYGTVMIVEAPDFYAENLSIINSYGVEAQNGPQALALRTDNDRAALFNCSLRSFQDTWRTSCSRITDRHYALGCFIEGSIDYIFGAADALFERCSLYNVRSGSVIVAPSHKPGTRWGYVFRDCIIDGNEKAADGNQYLGRPWHNDPIALFIDTTFDIPVAPEGWTNMGVLPKLFAESNSRNKVGRPADLSRRKNEYLDTRGNTGTSKTTVSQEEIADHTYENMVMADDGWDPRQYMEI